MKGLRELTKRAGDVLRADDWNSLAQQARARALVPGHINAESEDGDHEWRVKPSRLEDRENRKWRLDITPGFINDAVPTILYLRENDPRGWVMPLDYPAPRQGERGFHPTMVDRDLLERDTPWLLVQSPSEPTGNTDWTPVPDNQRIPFFQTAEMWEKKLYSGHVILSAAPLKPNFGPYTNPAPALVQYRLFHTPRPPVRTFGARLGGWIELAKLWLVRDEDEDPARDEIKVQPREKTSLAAAIVEPGKEVLDIFDLLARDGGVVGLFASLAQSQLETEFEAAASVEFWTV